MKSDLLDVIRSVGHWRINVQPVVPISELLLLGKCREAVEKAHVSMRGWDFPHINYRNDDEGGYEMGENFCENWTNWSGFNEFWRMYQSSQFLTYVSLREDTNPMGGSESYKGSLNVTGAIYQFTEVTEFCHRLYVQDFYKEGARLKISLRNSKGRRLSVGQNRMPFFPDRTTSVEKIDLEVTMSSSDLDENNRAIAIGLCVRLFDHFGWNPDPTQLQADQEGFYRQDWKF